MVAIYVVSCNRCMFLDLAGRHIQGMLDTTQSKTIDQFTVNSRKLKQAVLYGAWGIGLLSVCILILSVFVRMVLWISLPTTPGGRVSGGVAGALIPDSFPESGAHSSCAALMGCPSAGTPNSTSVGY